MMPAMRKRWTPARIAAVSAGAAIWSAIVAAPIWAASAGEGESSALGRAIGFAGADPHVVAAELPYGWLYADVRVLAYRDGDLRPCGRVRSVADEPVGAQDVSLELYPDAGVPSPLPPDARLWLLDRRGTLEWALSHVFSAERREALNEQMQAIFAERGEWLRATLSPLLAEHSQGVIADVMAEVGTFLESRRDRLLEIGEELVGKMQRRWELIFRDRLWPQILDGLSPIAVAIGGELWGALPWGDLASAAARSAGSGALNWLLPERWEMDTSQFDRWRDGYIRNTAIPIVERHLPEALAVVSRVLTTALADPEITAEIRATLMDDGLGDSRILALISEAFGATVLGNPRIRERVGRFLDDPRLHRALFDLADAIEPRLMELVKRFVLDPVTGRLLPELAMVARVRLLDREPRWILLELPEATGTAAPPALPRRPAIRRWEDSTADAWERDR
jgi:hypothetical protein